MPLSGPEVDCLGRLGPLLYDLLSQGPEGSFVQLPQVVWSVIDQIDPRLVADQLRLFMSHYYSSRPQRESEPVAVLVSTTERPGYYILTRLRAGTSTEFKPPFHFVIDAFYHTMSHIPTRPA
jgi:hypothetical protein